MSSCLVLSNGDSVIIASDSSISTIYNNEIKRVGINQQKVFRTKNSLIFCSGLISLVEDTMRFINSIEEVDSSTISKYLLNRRIIKKENIFSIEIIIVQTTPGIKMYQISEYNNFIPIELKAIESSLSIYCAGFKTDILSRLAEEKFSVSRDVIKNIHDIYEEIACEQIGGFLEIWKVRGKTAEKIYRERIKERDYVSSYKTDGTHSVVGDVIVGKILAGNELTIENENNNFILDANGATLNNAKFNIQTTNTKITIDPTATRNFVIQKNEGGTFVDKFWVDNAGNVNFSGNLTGATGTFSGTITATTGSLGGWTINSTGISDAYGNYINSNGNIKLGGLSISGSTATFTGNIYADKLVGAVSYSQLTDIPASKITSGTMSGNRIYGGTASLSSISAISGDLGVSGNLAVSGGSILANGTITTNNGYFYTNNGYIVAGNYGITTTRSISTPLGTKLISFRGGICIGFT